ncbi:MAG: hypothetical protein V7655_03240 [Aequorivita antarctica]
MARIKNGMLSGSLGELTFTYDEYGPIVKEKSKVDKKRIKNSPSSKGTREGNMEMGGASMAAKDLRLVFMLKKNNLGDQYFSGRLSGRMRKLVLLGGGLSGQRKLDIRKNGSLLEGFEFINARPLVYAVGGIKKKPSFNKERNEVRWSSPTLDRKEQITAPEEATHFTFKFGAATVSNYEYSAIHKKYWPLERKFKNLNVFTESDPLALKQKTIAPVKLSIKLTDGIAIPEDVAVVTVIGISFYKNINGELLEVSNTGGMKILGVE